MIITRKCTGWSDEDSNTGWCGTRKNKDRIGKFARPSKLHCLFGKISRGIVRWWYILTEVNIHCDNFHWSFHTLISVASSFLKEMDIDLMHSLCTTRDPCAISPCAIRNRNPWRKRLHDAWEEHRWSVLNFWSSPDKTNTRKDQHDVWLWSLRFQPHFVYFLVIWHFLSRLFWNRRSRYKQCCWVLEA